jgi:hypothetical protein
MQQVVVQEGIDNTSRESLSCHDKQTSFHKQTHEQTNKQTNKQTSSQTNKQTIQQANKPTNQHTSIQIKKDRKNFWRRKGPLDSATVLLDSDMKMNLGD